MSVYSSWPLILKLLRETSGGCCWKHLAANDKKSSPASSRKSEGRDWGADSVQEHGMLYRGALESLRGSALEMHNTHLLGGKTCTLQPRSSPEKSRSKPGATLAVGVGGSQCAHTNRSVLWSPWWKACLEMEFNCVSENHSDYRRKLN